jgi:polysaccharide export outer membrane protein
MKEALHMARKRILRPATLLLLASVASVAQQPSAAPPVAPAAMKADDVAVPVKSGYKLGVGDSLLIRVSNVPELTEKTFRIDGDGTINAPVVGRINAGKLTVDELQKELNKRLGYFLEEPDAIVILTESQSQPISIFGEVASPGVHPLQGRKTLIEMISTAGGVRPTAGPMIRITRQLEFGRIPLPGAADDPTGKFSIAQLEMKPLVGALTPENDIEIQPHDIISVPRAELIYVAGDVTRSGPLPLTERPTISLIEALSATGGVLKTADTKRARILRAVPGNPVRQQVPVNIAKIMSGKANDVQLVAGDILVVPPSNAKKAAQKALEVAIQMGTMVMTTGVVAGTL